MGAYLSRADTELPVHGLTVLPGRQGFAHNKADCDHAADLKIHLLGQFAVTVGSRVVDPAAWRLRKTKTLFKMLALEPSHRLHRDQIMDALWPNLGTTAATNNLHKVLHYARHVLEPDLSVKQTSAYIRVQSDVVRLYASEGIWLDVEAFEQTARVALLTGNPADCEEALRLYSGDLLPDDRYEDWVLGRREQVELLHGSLLLQLAGILEGRGEVDEAIRVLREVLARDPTQEDAHKALMRLFVGAGRRSLALRQYRRLRTILREEMNAEPDSSAQALYEQIVNNPAPTQVPLTSHELHVAHAIPIYEGPVLVGRREEMEHLSNSVDCLIDGQGSLTLLTGVAGIGKTSLAQAAMEYAVACGVTVFYGSSRESGVPYGLFSGGIARFLASPAGTGLENPATDGLQDLITSIPSLAVFRATGRDSCPLPAVDRWTAASAIVGFFAQICEYRPLMVVLEDLEAADEDSLGVLHFLARSCRRDRLLLLLSHRSEEVGEGTLLCHLLEKFHGMPHMKRLDVLGLASHEMSQLVCQQLGSPSDHLALKAVEEISQGNPYYAKESVQALRGRGKLRYADGIWQLVDGQPVIWDRDKLRRHPSFGTRLPVPHPSAR